MKKFLLSTAAAVGASAVAAGAVAMPLQSFNDEGTPILSASITASFEAGWADSSAAGPGEENSGFINGRWGEVYFSGEMTADNGLTYGARINLQTTFGPGGNIGRANQGREYLYLKGGWGSLELGKAMGAETALNLNIAGQYKGGGGIDWPWWAYQSFPGGVIFGGVHNSPHWWDTQQTKASYFTPVVGGLQAGISYTPLQGSDLGLMNGNGRQGLMDGRGVRSEADGGYRDEIGFGVQYNGDFGGTSVSVAAVGATSDDNVKTGSPTLQGVGFYQVGGIVRAGGASFGVGFWDAGEFSAPVDTSQDWTGWMVDATYSFGPYGVEVSYTHSEVDRTGGTTHNQEIDAWAVGMSYAVAPGLKAYGDLMGADYMINGTANDATILVGGITLSF